MNKIIVILGPTASGKTDLSIKLAKKYKAEVVSADSRQVYRGLDIGSGKITKKEMQGVPHYLLDVANPKTKFSVAQYQKLAIRAINQIHKHGRVALLAGGSPFYIQAVIDGIIMPEVKPDWNLRKQLEKLSNEQLFEKLEKMDANRANGIDKNNPRRLIRALEIVIKTGQGVPAQILKPNPGWDILQIGILKNRANIKKLIAKRLKKRLEKNAMINEVKKLRANGLPWKRFEELGLEYRYVAQYLQGKITKEEMIDKIQLESERFAKRQMTWFKRDQRIHWAKNQRDAFSLAQKFLKK